MRSSSLSGDGAPASFTLQGLGLWEPVMYRYIRYHSPYARHEDIKLIGIRLRHISCLPFVRAVPKWSVPSLCHLCPSARVDPLCRCVACVAWGSLRACIMPLSLLRELPLPVVPAAGCLIGSNAGAGAACLGLLPIPAAAPAAQGLLAGLAAGTYLRDTAVVLMLRERRAAGPPLATAGTERTLLAPRPPPVPPLTVLPPAASSIIGPCS